MKSLLKVSLILLLASVYYEYEDMYDNAYALNGYYYSEEQDNVFQQLYHDARRETHFTVFEGVNGVFYHAVGAGQFSGGTGGSVITYRFLTGDISYTNPFDATKKGYVVGGPSIHIDRLMAQLFPTLTEVVRAAIPDRVGKFYDGLFLGTSCGWDFDRGGFTYGYNYGYRQKF